MSTLSDNTKVALPIALCNAPAATELKTLLDVTAGTVEVGKVIVPTTAKVIDALTVTTLQATTFTPTTVVRTGSTRKVGGGRAKVGTSAGWVVGAANNLGTIGTVAASQSGGTLVVPITGLHVGDTITGFGVYSSINSAGGTVTLDCDLRKLVIAAGANATDSSIGTMTQVSVVAATASAATKTGLTEVVVAGTNYYLLLTCTTAGSTTVELAGLEITVTES